MNAFPSRFAADESGAAVVEYAILIACIALVVLAALTLLGDEIQAGWDLANSMLDA